MSDERFNDPKYIAWAKAVKVKFNYKCIICFVSGESAYLESHHINSWDWDIANRYNLDNSACLCKKCHTYFHSIFGYGGNHSYQFEQFKKIYNILKNIVENNNKISENIKSSEVFQNTI